ncbi:hypothetical protein HPP92_013239 [Vanilla planifolia]|uniref:Uncharacterized protein n=1 Tax=Vanilla planifolia TaxID=51239 RepID=A0A835QRB1_VANPL|nr:hypothetical protein HPP92_013239 [Vanilla planifolia]
MKGTIRHPGKTGSITVNPAWSAMRGPCALRLPLQGTFLLINQLNSFTEEIHVVISCPLVRRTTSPHPAGINHGAHHSTTATRHAQNTPKTPDQHRPASTPHLPSQSSIKNWSPRETAPDTMIPPRISSRDTLLSFDSPIERAGSQALQELDSLDNTRT